MTRYLLYLRIAFTALCGLVAVLLWVALPVSYARIPLLPIAPNYYAAALKGDLIIADYTTNNALVTRIWIPAFIATAIAAALVILGAKTLPRWKYSLRTLLVVTTLVALCLGCIVYAVRG